MRVVPPSLDRAAVAEIDKRLRAIERGNNVVIPLAVESGSRAWGFPSPDSDYDCRFIFVRRANDYLSLFPQRDVIETHLDANLDVNGWDVGKAIKLLLKGNAVVIEWLTSPIIYCADRWFRDEFLAVASSHASRTLVARHYLHLGERQRGAYFADDAPLPLKKLFYVIRPAAALRWLRLHPGQAVAPMNFPTLIAQCDIPKDVAAHVDELIAKKSVTRELGMGAVPGAVSSFIDAEFALARAWLTEKPQYPSTSGKADAQRFFLEVLARRESF